MKYFIMYVKLRITLFIATHFYMEPEYLKELSREFTEYGNSIGLNRDDMSLLLFILMGDAKEGNLNDILKKVKLPRVAHGLILIRGYRTGHMRKYIQNGMSTDQH